MGSQDPFEGPPYLQIEGFAPQLKHYQGYFSLLPKHFLQQIEVLELENEPPPTLNDFLKMTNLKLFQFPLDDWNNKDLPPTAAKYLEPYALAALTLILER